MGALGGGYSEYDFRYSRTRPRREPDFYALDRAYVYSKADKFVDYRAIEEHANHAEKNGFVVVKREKFEGSTHIAHARAEPQRY